MGENAATAKTWCPILDIVSRPPRQIGGLGKLNTCCLSCVFIAIVATWFD